MMNKIDKIIQHLELDYIEFTAEDEEKKKLSLPLVERSQIKAMFWNLLTSEKWRAIASYGDYEKIFDKLTERLKTK